MSIFYPLGLLSPIIIPHMIFLQTLLLEKLEYGELTPPQLWHAWNKQHQQIPFLSHTKLSHKAVHTTLYAFSVNDNLMPASMSDAATQLMCHLRICTLNFQDHSSHVAFFILGWWVLHLAKLYSRAILNVNICQVTLWTVSSTVVNWELIQMEYFCWKLCCNSPKAHRYTNLETCSNHFWSCLLIIVRIQMCVFFFLLPVVEGTRMVNPVTNNKS